MKNFALIGTAGYVAPRHLKAILDTGNNLVASYDISDSVGIIDRYFPDAPFFTNKQDFTNYLESLKQKGISIDYFSICTPNHLHEEQINMAFKLGANVICEKPIVINPSSIDAIISHQEIYNKKVFTILQLRLLDQLINLKKKVQDSPATEAFKVDLEYITPRGNWYHKSWKGNEQKSGGIITNIGIHLFDLLIWLFGDVKEMNLESYTKDKAKGSLALENANVSWFLSIDKNDLTGKNLLTPSYRSIKINEEELEFSQGFENLHTKSYDAILKGNGFDIFSAKPSIDLVYQLRTIGNQLQ